MLAFNGDSVNAGKTARMEQRTTPEAKELIERAASMLGVNASEFTVAATTEAARRTLQQYATTVLMPEDQAAFLEALDATEPTPAMVDLMRLHAEITGKG